MNLCVVEAYSVGLRTSRKNWTAAVLGPVEVFDSWTCPYLRADPSLLPPGSPPGSYKQNFLASFPICLCSDFLKNINRLSPHCFWVAGPSCTRWMFSSLYSRLLGRSGMRRISTPYAGSFCVAVGSNQDAWWLSPLCFLQISNPAELHLEILDDPENCLAANFSQL